MSSREHVLVVSAAHREALGRARAVPGLRGALAPADNLLWLRGLPATLALPLPVRALPAVARYVLDAQGRLFEPGRLAPTSQLPALAWQPLGQLLPLEVPTAALPGQPRPGYAPRLVRSAQVVPGAALLTTLAAWLAYAEAAPEVRLQPLRFAAAADGRVLVLGTPLPPLPGQEHWQHEALLLPAGYALEAPLLAPVLSQLLSPAGEALVLLGPAGDYELLPQAHLLPATRADVRLTAAALRHE